MDVKKPNSPSVNEIILDPVTGHRLLLVCQPRLESEQQELEREKQQHISKKGKQKTSASAGMCCAAFGPAFILLSFLIRVIHGDLAVWLFFLGFQVGCLFSIIALILGCYGFRFLPGKLAVGFSALWWVWVAWLSNQHWDL